MDTARKDILSKLNEYSGTTPEEAKLSFLNEVHKLETFGSAFFEVRQTTDHSLPQKILVAIMKRGIIIIDPTSKELNLKYDLSGYPLLANRGKLIQKLFWNCHFPGRYTGRFTGKLIQTKCYISVKKFEWIIFPVKRLV